MSYPPDIRPDSEPDPPADSEVASNERTNERTDAADTYGCLSGAGSRRERTYDDLDGMVAVGSVVAAGELWRTNERHPVIRTGEREPIPRYVRAAVWYRDQGQCAECPSGWVPDGPLHLDHITPWSAGGADTTDNLRLLCEYHNLERSNFIDFARPKRPATWWCSNCYAFDEHVWVHHYPDVTCPRHGTAWNPDKIWCRVARAYARAWQREEPRPTWHERPLLTAFDQIAYCAHCNAPGMTGVVL